MLGKVIYVIFPCCVVLHKLEVRCTSRTGNFEFRLKLSSMCNLEKVSLNRNNRYSSFNEGVPI